MMRLLNVKDFGRVIIFSLEGKDVELQSATHYRSPQTLGTMLYIKS